MDHEQALEEFERAWQAARPLELREVLARIDVESSDQEGRRRLVFELIMVDFWHRWRSAGCRAAARPAAAKDWPPLPRLDDYARRYPDLLPGDEFPVAVIGEEYRVRRRFGDRPTHAEYLHRYSRQSTDLAPLLTRIDAETPEQPSSDSSDTTLAPGQAPAQPSKPQPAAADFPSMIGKYVILAPLDRGGQGQVFRAMHPQLRQELVIKLGHGTTAPANQETLVAEARVLAQLDHPHLVRVHDLGFHEDRPYVVLDYVPGRNLREVMRSGPLAPRRSAEIIAKLARALAVVHAHGITHGDLKPANILIDVRGEPRLIDFGLARERSPLDPEAPEGNQIAGTLLYMSPEQAAGDLSKVGAASDVFGLGTVLYELLVGHPPREAAPDSDMLDQALKGEVDLEALLSPEIPSKLAAICRHALAPRPADRHATIEALADELERWQASLPRDGRRRRLIRVAATAGALTLAIGAALLANPAARPRQTPGQAAARWVGHQPHHDFALQMEVVGRPADGGVVALTEGDTIALRLQSEVDCYAGVWHIDGAGTIKQLFPNETEQDHFVAANRPMTIPGRDSYEIKVSPGIGPEYLWVACSSRPWSPQAGHERGPAAVLGRGPGKSCQRDAVVVARSGPRVSEAVVQIQVRSATRPAGKGSELVCLGSK